MEDLTSRAPARLLDTFLADWTAKGWPIDDAHRFRMGPDPDPEPTPDPDPDPDPDPTPEKTPEELLADAAAEAEKWKALARKHENQAKANASKAKEYDQLKASQMSDTEKAVEEAKQAGRQEALAETGKILAAAEIRVALTGVVPDPAEIVEDLDLSKYLTDTGEVDAEKVQKLRSKYEAMAKPGKGGPDLRQGNRGGDAPAQITRADMAAMTPEQIVKARQEGRLNEVLGIKST